MGGKHEDMELHLLVSKNKIFSIIELEQPNSNCSRDQKKRKVSVFCCFWLRGVPVSVRCPIGVLVEVTFNAEDFLMLAGWRGQAWVPIVPRKPPCCLFRSRSWAWNAKQVQYK